MELTRDKYQEAEFFLSQMEETVDKDTFRYHLCAFASSSRATTQVLQNEYRKSENKDVFGSWYGEMKGGCDSPPPKPGTVQDYMSNDDLFNFMNSLRNAVLKKKGLPLTTATMLTEADISPTSIELLSKEGLPVPQVILETTDGEIISSTLGYAWKIEEIDGWITLLSFNPDGGWSAVSGISGLDYDTSKLQCRYRFNYDTTSESIKDLFWVRQGPEDQPPSSFKKQCPSPRDVNCVISELCRRYLQDINSILNIWEEYTVGKISKEELIDSDFTIPR